MSEHTDKIDTLLLQLASNGKVIQTQSEELRRRDSLIKGSRLILAALVHQVGGEVELDEKTLRLMESGNFVLEQKSQKDPVSIRVIVTEKAPDATQENEG